MAELRSVRVLFRIVCTAVVLATAFAVQTYAAMAAPDAAIVVDAKTGKTLYADNPDAKRYPASLTKMMTLYLLFEALHEGRTGLNAVITVSAHAAAQEPSKLDVPVGGTISVRDAILSLVTRSANDMAVAIAEYLAGSERAFAAQMTKKARDLGMSSTTFRNASGLPDSGQVTTARDLATLGRALREHYPEYYSFFSTTAFVWDGERIANHNPLLGDVDGVDGIKTGYTIASGFNLVTSIKRDGREVVAVVIGGETAAWRDAHMADLIDTYFKRASGGPHTAAAIPGGPPPAREVPVAGDAATPLPRPRPVDDPLPVAVASAAPIVSHDSGFAVAAIGQGDATVKDEPASPPAAPSGWKIQLAASPTRPAAEDILDRALSSAQTVLASAKPYTEPVSVGKDTLYRARFSGFATQQAAKNACAYLVKHNFQCLPTSD
jgi:D-alanyl-D-alanine carboxypeptidase